MTELKIYLSPDGDLVLPTAKNSILQGVFYGLLAGEPELSAALHDLHSDNSPTYKFFCIGNIRGKYSVSDDGRRITYHGPLVWRVRSAFDEMIQVVARELERRGGVLFGSAFCPVSSLELCQRFFFEDRLDIKMDMPLAVYKKEQDGKKFYLTPDDDRFYEIAANNLKNKYRIFYETDFAPDVTLIPLQVSPSDMTVVKYKQGFVTAFGGKYSLRGDPDIITLAYYSGIGSKNSQGFGTIDTI